MTNPPLYYFTFQEKSVFIPLKSVYPECLVLIEPSPQLSPLQCFSKHCPANSGCAEIIAKRINYLFTMVVPNAELMVLYFKYRDRPKSIRGGIFTRDMEDPRCVTLNPWAFRKFQRGGDTYQWIPTTEFLFLGKGTDLIPVENILTKP